MAWEKEVKMKNKGGKMKSEKEMIEELEAAVGSGDNESIHILYDTFIENIAQNYKPKLVKKLRKVVEEINFWYA